MKLYINNENVLKHNDDLYEFVKAYYIESNPSTYTEEDCNLKSLQCSTGSYRSFQDMLFLCQTYFPETTAKDLAVIWRRLYNAKIIDVLWCHDIEKVTSCYCTTPDCWDACDYDGCNWDGECEYGWSKNKIYDLATSDISYNDMLKLAKN